MSKKLGFQRRSRPQGSRLTGFCSHGGDAAAGVAVSGNHAGCRRTASYPSFVSLPTPEIPLVVHAALSSRERDTIRAVTRSQRTLADVVRWGLAVTPARLVEDVIKQDEFTQDVIVPYDDRRYLVYDTT